MNFDRNILKMLGKIKKKKQLINPILNNMIGDRDNDKVQNIMDCQPRNRFKQGPGDKEYPLHEKIRYSETGSVWLGNMLFDNKKAAEKYRKHQLIYKGRIVSTKPYGSHILIKDSKGKLYSTKNIAPIGCRILFDGIHIHGINKKPDIVVNYEL